MASFFYDNQIRRFLIQFARVFSDWQVTKGNDPAGNPILVRVPIQYGDSSRQASTIIANNSASSVPSAPMITYYISGLEYDQKRTQDPFFIDKMNVRRRTYNADTQQFENTQGQAFTVERLMPVPYTLRITVDFWTTNYNQKLELIEQLGVLFNPAMELQSTDNFIDWTSLSVVYQDGLTFSSRSIPVGSGNPIDVMSWKFYMPVWISSSAKVKKLGVIHKIINSIFQGNALTDMKDDSLLLGTREKVTPYGYKVLLIGNSLQLVPGSQPSYPNNEAIDLPENPNTQLYWTSLLNVYGTIKPSSQIWLDNPYLSNPIVATFALHPSDDRILLLSFDNDTLPQDTLAPVDRVINPHVIGPQESSGIEHGLPEAADGQRYLIVEGLDGTSVAWGSVTANPNDIIQYVSNTGRWEVAFDSQLFPDTQFVTNLYSGVQYRWADGVWMKSYEGWYSEGDYSIVI